MKYKNYWFIFLLILSLGYCVSRTSIVKPTAENIEKWEKRKYELITIHACELMKEEITNDKNEKMICSSKFEGIVSLAKHLTMLDDEIGISGYRSMDHIKLSIDEIKCPSDVVMQWKKCSTRFSRIKPDFE